MKYVQSITVNPCCITIERGCWFFDISATVYPSNATCKSVTWSSSNSLVASVNYSNGWITGRDVGTATIYAHATDGSGVKGYCTVTVTAPVSVSSVNVNPPTLSMCIGEEETLTATVFPSNASDKSVIWCSSNPDIATVTYEGKVTANQAGSVIITATSVDGCHTGQCSITVTKPSVTIKKDGNFNKVVFNSSGKVWYCINQDLLFNEESVDDSITARSYNNYRTKLDDQTYRINVFDDEEIKLLYVIDPYGVAHYINTYAQWEKGSLKDQLEYKDHIFELLFKRKPSYFARTILDGKWYVTTDIDNLSTVVSESELLFGIHPIYDFNTLIDFIGLVADIANMIFNTTYFLSANAKKIVDIFFCVISVGEAIVKNELISCAAGEIIEDQFEKIDDELEKVKLTWALDWINIYEDIFEVIENLADKPRYFTGIITYIAVEVNFDVFLELKSGTLCKMEDVHKSITQL